MNLNRGSKPLNLDRIIPSFLTPEHGSPFIVHSLLLLRLALLGPPSLYAVLEPYPLISHIQNSFENDVLFCQRI